MRQQVQVNQELADGTWHLKVQVEIPGRPNDPITFRKRVRGDRDHVGGLIQKIVDSLNGDDNISKQNWSEYELWWPVQRKWLLKHHWMLDKYSIQADTELLFTNRNKVLNIELPNNQCLKMLVNFSSDVLSVVRDICYICEIRHHTELSLVKTNGVYANTRAELAAGISQMMNPIMTSGAINSNVPYCTLRNPRQGGNQHNNDVLSSGTKLIDTNNIEYRKLTTPAERIDPDDLNAPKNMKDKVSQTCRFLDSLKSLMEQGVKENELIKLRFKYFNFQALSEKNDFIRIHQLYEQLKFSVLSDEFNITEDQALTLASLQFFVDECTRKQIFDTNNSQSDGILDRTDGHSTSFDIDNMLDSLENELEGKPLNQPDLVNIPELSELVRVHYPNKLLQIGKFQDKKWLIYKDTFLDGYKQREDAASSGNAKRLCHIEIKRAELTKETSIKDGIYIIKIKPHDNEEIWLKFDQENQFCKWYAALKLGCKGTTMASNNYKLEIDRLKQVIKIQDLSTEKIHDQSELQAVQSKFYVPRKYFKKLGHQKIATHILTHQLKIGETVRQQPTVAKLNYINLWEHIEESGRAYFQVAFKKDQLKKEEFVALSSEKIMRLDPSGKIVQSWWLQTLREWKINWAAEPKRVELFLNKGSQDSEKVEFFIPSHKNSNDRNKDLQVIHEYIGGYMFHHMSKVLEPDRAEEATLRGILDVTDPWHNK